MLKARSSATRSLCSPPAVLSSRCTQLESYAKLGGRSAGRDTQDLVQGGLIDSVGRKRHSIEVLTQDLARQENRADAQAPPANFGRGEVLISFVLLGLADVSDWRLVDITARSRGGILGDEDFRAHRIWCWNRKCDFVADSDKLRKKTGHEKLGLIGEHTGGRLLLQRDADHALAADRKGRIEGRKSHAVGGHYRGALRRCKMPIRTQCRSSSLVRKSFPALVKLTGLHIQRAS